MSPKPKMQQKLTEEELNARAQALIGKAKPAKITVRVDYTHEDSILYITLPKLLGGGTTTATMSGEFSLLYTFGKDPYVATVSLAASKEQISSIHFVYKGANTESGDIVYGLDDFDLDATRGRANFKSGEFQMSYYFSPQVPFLSKQKLSLPKKRMLNKETGIINPKTYAFRLATRISIKVGPFTGLELIGSEGGNHQPPAPSCHATSIDLTGVPSPNDIIPCGDYTGNITKQGTFCGSGICNNSDKWRMRVDHGGKQIWIEPKTCSDALNGMEVAGNWFVHLEGHPEALLCQQFPPHLGVALSSFF